MISFLLCSMVIQTAGKIDAPVQRQIDAGSGRAISVYICAEDQLLPFGNAFAEWTSKRDDADRLVLQGEVVADLKARSSQFRKSIRAALPGKAFQSTWIVNGVGARLTGDEIKEAAALSSVKYIYSVPAAPAIAPRGRVGAVLKADDQKEWHLGDKKVPWNIRGIKADQVWEDLKVTGEGSIVAVLDGGVDYTHSDLKDSIWINPGEVANNGEDDDKNGYPDDLYGWDFNTNKPEVKGPASRGRNHGTMTSGITAGSGASGTQTGVAPGAKLMPVKAGGPMQTMLAYQYAIENGADVISMSFSIPNLGNARGLWRLMCEHATIAGLVSVSGAGNFQQSQKIPVQQRIPEGIPCVVSAGGVDINMKVPRFCSLGPVEWADVKFYNDHPMPKGLIKPDVSGYPGAGYPVLDAAAGKGLVDPNNSIRGNSFSCPHAAGTAAMMFSANQSLPAWLVQQILMETAVDISPAGKDNRTGAGLINALEAVKAAAALK